MTKTTKPRPATPARAKPVAPTLPEPVRLEPSKRPAIPEGFKRLIVALAGG